MATLAADASRRAALLVAYIRPVCALLAPCRAGASTPRNDALISGRALNASGTRSGEIANRPEARGQGRLVERNQQVLTNLDQIITTLDEDPTARRTGGHRCELTTPPSSSQPHADDPRLRDRDDFLYREDADGLLCPLGAHIRRSNPRDDIKPYPAAESLSMSEAHRLLRRARVFGSPLFDPTVLADPTSAACRAAITALADDGRARGIHFFSVGASIRSQFEFVQQTWCNNPRFAGLTDNKDAIAGDNDRSDQPSSHMTIPGIPRRTRTGPLPRFVTVRAGAYLFMPGLRAIRYLAAGGA